MKEVADCFHMDHSGGAGLDESLPLIAPAATVELDVDFDGQWFVTGDIDGDGEVEIVTARNAHKWETAYVSSVTARKLDGTVLWSWGSAADGGWRLGYDVACQIHDWDGDGKAEVIFATRGELIVLDGATGAERFRLLIPDSATDCVTFADLTGRGRRGEVIVKDRYNNTWAMDITGKVLWHLVRAGGYRSAHQPYPMDIDGDGREELLVGYALADGDGKLLWTFEPDSYPEPLGHLDCCRVLRRGPTPADWRLAVTLCGHRELTMLTGAGEVVWRRGFDHYESIDIGYVIPGCEAPQILVDVGQDNRHAHPLWLINEDGDLLGEMYFDNTRFHTLLDVQGVGNDQIVQPNSRGVFDHRGRRVATLDMPGPGDAVQRGDMTGSGTVGMAISVNMNAGEPGTPAICLFEVAHEFAKKATGLGCGCNFTLY